MQNLLFKQKNGTLTAFVSGELDHYLALSVRELTSVFFKKLASASDVSVCDSYSDEGSVSIITPAARIYIPLGELVDMEAEKKRLEKEAEKVRSETERIEKKLSNEGFVKKAPAAVIEGERKKLASYKEKLAGIEDTLKKFK